MWQNFNFLFGREPAEGGSGYSISVTYNQKGKPVVQVKTYGEVDVAELRRDIEQRYSRARIEGLEKKPLIRIVDEEEEEKRGKKKPSTGSKKLNHNLTTGVLKLYEDSNFQSFTQKSNPRHEI